MNDFSFYDIPKDKYSSLVANYLQNPGTQFMNAIRLKYDLINNYKNRLIEFWELFDINKLEQNYKNWKKEFALPDSEYIYTEFIELLCASYQITREYYSYYVPPGETLETGRIELNNLNMLRLLKVRRSSVGYDGTREMLLEILNNTLNNPYASDESSTLNFLLQTKTSQGEHASLVYYINRPTTNDDMIWGINDLCLFKDGQYFIQLLGIEVSFEEVSSDTLIYDVKTYDAGNKYK